MARLENYPEAVRNHLLKLPCPNFDSTPFNRPIPMKEQRVALVSTAGLHLRETVRLDLEMRIIA